MTAKSRTLSVAAIQFAPGPDMESNIARAIKYVREAADRHARIIVLPELFCGPYFCKTQDEAHFARAHPAATHPAVTALAAVSRETGTVIPVSIFERDGPHYYNSIVMLDNGERLGTYRKSHIPDGPGYQEKFYFRPGDTGFKVWETSRGNIGVGICWDQWFPEAARAMALMGADILLYPTAIGAEPQDAGLDTAARLRRAMIGHAVSNVIPVVAANRIGDEDGQLFYGTSFIAGHTGEIISDMGRADEGVICATFDLSEMTKDRAAWGFFRDRRPDLYTRLTD